MRAIRHLSARHDLGATHYQCALNTATSIFKTSGSAVLGDVTSSIAGKAASSCGIRTLSSWNQSCYNDRRVHAVAPHSTDTPRALRMVAKTQHQCTRSLHSQTSYCMTANDNGNGPEKEDERTGLPMTERVKNILAANWRAQVTTINAACEEGAAASVHSSLEGFMLLPGGRPTLLLSHSDSASLHIQNLSEDVRGSVTLGHTDPAPLARRLRAADSGRPLLPRATLVGTLHEVPEHQRQYLLQRLQKAAWAEDAARSPAPFADQPHLLRAAYAMDVTEVRFVDGAGASHAVDKPAVDAAFTDPLAANLAQVLMSQTDPELRMRLVMFCAAYLGVIGLEDAFLIGADRRGFTVGGIGEGGLLQHPDGSRNGLDDQAWREFRFAFSDEVANMEGFERHLTAMADEVESQQGDSAPDRQSN